ncbi:MAG: hypothetical protein HY260_18740 [Chloroflexi bacterium]|nr:hypothetical protein [Chloroflexota bacterium]
MVVVDTDVLLLEFAFHRDPRAQPSRDFLGVVRDRQPATTVYNLMELLGHLSFNLSPDRLEAWPEWLQRAFNLSILWPEAGGAGVSDEFFEAEIFLRPLAKMRAHRMAFLDSLVLGVAESAPDVTAFVTWNARHFKDKSPLPVLTPEEYLASGEP